MLLRKPEKRVAAVGTAELLPLQELSVILLRKRFVADPLTVFLWVVCVKEAEHIAPRHIAQLFFSGFMEKSITREFGKAGAIETEIHDPFYCKNRFCFWKI